VIVTGVLTMGAGNYWMSQMNLDISPGQAIWPRVVLIVGLAVCFAPANVAAYLYMPVALRGAAVGLLILLRNEGGSVGTSLAQTMQERRDQFHSLRLGEALDSFSAAARSFLDQAAGPFLQRPAIRLPRSNWPCRRWQTCASSRHRLSPILTCYGFWPRS
jgi:DHA2 family multidrug resistance protein